jgi:hypothetical protein
MVNSVSRSILQKATEDGRQNAEKLKAETEEQT